ncbi:DnaJ-domain-containing protein [Sistotremastrum niveocremeum HHB9708]|uniref:DnaJ-domain-containing protein n=2 Tax=Sistotremastraceae TaxID=3402574 RepID=A0A164TNG0_9AGAM|nr:DnaJ-domain-containing protein [Sistotremastrum niveocremeum HHB9708]KZT42176.1 DnaJ-domain-containing protein [Sistotremastrum suecicum HHB10207 ss-3]
MPSDTSLYVLLGVSPGASTNEIKKAYRKKAMQHHPNPNDPSAAQKFQEMAAAYEILIDDEARSAYDAYGLDGLKSMGSDGGMGGMAMDPEEFLAHLFGGGGGFPFSFGEEPGPSRRGHGEDEVIPIEVTLEDLYNGKTVKMTLEHEVVCSTCKGSGAKGSVKPHKCARCDGKGFTFGTTHIDRSHYGTSRQPCPDCNGRGETVREKDRCKKCKGKRTLKEKKRQEIVIEPGSSNGQKIVLHGEGDQKPNVRPGDIIFVLRLQPHQSFERSGHDLMTTVHLTLSEALLGFSRVLITHLDGRGVKVTSPKGKIIKAGDSIILRGDGMPIPGSSHSHSSATKGDLYVLFEIEMPTESWLETVDHKALEQLLPPKKSESVPGVSVVDEGRFEAADITAFGENDEDWVDDDDEDDEHDHDGPGECVHQ